MPESLETPIWRNMKCPPASSSPQFAPIVIVGGGPVGLTLALDLGRRGHGVILLNRLDYVASGSRAICFAKRSIEIFDRLKVGEPLVQKGVTWNIGKVFRGDDVEPIYSFDLLPIKDQKRPAFINIQQYHVEDQLIAALECLPNVQLRWGHEAVAVMPGRDGVDVIAACARVRYPLQAQYLIACDGSRSTVRQLMGLEFEGRGFKDNFLIADIRMKGDRPAERWFWFDPPFNGARSALLHKQPDDVWRLDFQIGWNVDRDASLKPENVERYVRSMLGPTVEFEREWYSLYSFQCRRMSRFVHGRVLFAGDSAHLVSPFGARGCNGGLADADNLAWKLDLILRREADERLLASYDHEAIVTADENMLHSTRATDFMTPQTAVSHAFRDAVLELAAEYAFARPFVNSGRLSTSVSYPDSPLNTPDEDPWEGGVKPGSPAIDAPLADQWLLDEVGTEFVLLVDGWQDALESNIRRIDLTERHSDLSVLRARYAMTPGSAYLLRPDQYVAARWKSPSAVAVTQALRRAKGLYV